jgi:hypothetical protein
MITAAAGAEEFFTKENGAGDAAALEEAREIDRRLINAWVGHP